VLVKGKTLSAKTPARARLYRCAHVMYTTTISRPSHTVWLPQGYGRTGATYRMMSEQIYYALASTLRFTCRQDLCQSAQGGGNPGKIWTRQPEHPGIAHYLIHLYDTPGSPTRARGGATYARWARGRRTPAMPSHIFTRRRLLAGVDRFQHRSIGVAKRCGFSRPAAFDGLHGLCLSAARANSKARAVLDNMNAGHRVPETFLPGPTHSLFRRRATRWSAATGSRRPTSGPPSPLANVQAITYFARALGAAVPANPEAAKTAIAGLPNCGQAA